MDARTDAAPGAGSPAMAMGEPARLATATAKPPSGRGRLFIMLGAVVILVGAIWGLEWLLVGRSHVTTDDAYVDADEAQVTPLVSGPIVAAPVTDTQPVKKGDVLVVIDPADFKLALAQDEAQLGQAIRRVQGYFASRDADSAAVAARASDVERARAELASAEADAAKAHTDLARRQALTADGAVSGDELTNAENRVRETEAAVTAARAQLASAQATRTSAVGQQRAAEVLVAGASVDDNPEVAAARVKVDQDKLSLSRTVIRAPIDGVVAKKSIQIGQRVETGAQLMTIVPIQSVYVDANFKEGQVRRMRLGQPAVLTSDLYGSGVKFHGLIAGLAGGTGSAFAVIPAQNATGNWIKVVQRLPVRIALEPRELKDHPLRVGLSMNVDVDVSK
jgi:membrane fusion protein (multidrug efflux system)